MQIFITMESQDDAFDMYEDDQTFLILNECEKERERERISLDEINKYSNGQLLIEL